MPRGPRYGMHYWLGLDFDWPLLTGFPAPSPPPRPPNMPRDVFYLVPVLIIGY